MIKSTYYYWLNKLDKVFPIAKLGVFFGVFVVISVIIVIALSIKGSGLNKEYYDANLKNEVQEIELRDNGFHYKINSSWYLIKHPIVNYIEVGDSIIKESQSLHIQIKSLSKVKWDKEVRKNIVFRKVPI